MGSQWRKNDFRESRLTYLFNSMALREGNKIIIDLRPEVDDKREKVFDAGVEVLERPKVEAQESGGAIEKYEAFGYAHGDTVVRPDSPTDVLALAFENNKVYIYRLGQPQARQSTKTPERYIPYRVENPVRAVRVYEHRLAVAKTMQEVVLLVESLSRAGVNLDGIVGKFAQVHDQATQLERAKERILHKGTEYISRAHGLRDKVEQLRTQQSFESDLKAHNDVPIRRAAEMRDEVVELTPAYLAIHGLPINGSVSVYDVKERRQREFVKLEGEKGGVFFRENFPAPINGSPLRIIEPLEPKVLVALLEASGGRYVVEQPKRFGTGQLDKRELRNPQAIVASRMQAFRDSLPGDIVVIGTERYRKKVQGLWELESLSPLGTVVVQAHGAGLDDSAVKRLIETRPNDAEYVKFMARSSEALPVVRESARELQAIHEQFAKVLLDLYPGVTTFKQGYIIRALDMMGLAGKKDIALSLRQEALNYFQSSESEIAQGGWYGDCYLLAAHNAGKRTAPGLVFEQMARSVRPGKKKGEYEVKIAAMDKESSEAMQEFFGERYRDGRIVVTYSEIEKILPGWASADLGDLILEKAYAQFIDFRERNSEKKKKRKLIFGKKRAFEGGFGHKALFDLYGDDLVEKHRIGDYSSADAYTTLEENGKRKDVEDLFVRFAEQPEKFIIVANTPAEHKPVNPNRLQRAMDYLGLAGGEVVDGLYLQHAYSVVGYENGTVYVENPHNTGKRVAYPLDDFLKRFAQISYVEIKKQYEPYEQPYLQQT